MNTRTKTLAALLLAACALPASATNPHFDGLEEKEITIFYADDSDLILKYESVRRTGDYATAWVRNRFAKPKKGEASFFTIQYSFGCSSRTIKRGYTVAYNTARKPTGSDDGEYSYSPVVPGTAGEKMLEIVCSDDVVKSAMSASIEVMFATDPAPRAVVKQKTKAEAAGSEQRSTLYRCTTEDGTARVYVSKPRAGLKDCAAIQYKVQGDGAAPAK